MEMKVWPQIAVTIPALISSACLGLLNLSPCLLPEMNLRKCQKNLIQRGSRTFSAWNLSEESSTPIYSSSMLKSAIVTSPYLVKRCFCLIFKRFNTTIYDFQFTKPTSSLFNGVLLENTSWKPVDRITKIVMKRFFEIACADGYTNLCIKRCVFQVIQSQIFLRSLQNKTG